MEQIQGDVKEPPRGVCVDENGMPVTPYVQLWMDNYSRKILSWRIGTNQQDTIALSSLRQLIETHGVPASILTDQGSIYNGKAMLHCTRTLGIVHKNRALTNHRVRAHLNESMKLWMICSSL